MAQNVFFFFFLNHKGEGGKSHMKKKIEKKRQRQPMSFFYFMLIIKNVKIIIKFYFLTSQLLLCTRKDQILDGLDFYFPIDILLVNTSPLTSTVNGHTKLLWLVGARSGRSQSPTKIDTNTTSFSASSFLKRKTPNYSL